MLKQKWRNNFVYSDVWYLFLPSILGFGISSFLTEVFRGIIDPITSTFLNERASEAKCITERFVCFSVPSQLAKYVFTSKLCVPAGVEICSCPLAASEKFLLAAQQPMLFVWKWLQVHISKSFRRLSSWKFGNLFFSVSFIVFSLKNTCLFSCIKHELPF